jgi:hypothetical protein
MKMDQQTHIDAAQLAALFDGELSKEVLDNVEQHVAGCSSCAAILEDMVLTHQAVLELPGVPAVDGMWPCIEAALDRDEVVVRKVPLRRWALAASVALLVGMTALFVAQTTPSGGDVSSLPVLAATAPIDFGLYLASLDHVGETPALPPGYEQKPTSLEDALIAIGITNGLNLDTLPADLKFRGAALITRGSSRMVQLTFEHNGEILVVLCQPDGEPVSFGKFDVKTTFIGRRKCLSASCGTYQALCLTTKKGTFTVVGPTKNARLTSLFETVTAA